MKLWAPSDRSTGLVWAAYTLVNVLNVALAHDALMVALYSAAVAMGAWLSWRYLRAAR